MQPPINQTQQRDRDLTDYLYTALCGLPSVIGGIESEAAALTNAKREAQANLEDAELNATLNAPQEGKNADARKLETAAALNNDPNVKKFRKEVMRYESELEMNEAEAKSKRREFQAAIALAELHAARINLMCHYQHNNTTTERKQQ
jgi:hypothetical protein